MTSRKLKSAMWLTLAASAVALAAGGPPDGKGNKPSTEVGNNLSVPAIMAGGAGDFGLGCPVNDWSTLSPPDKDPVYYAEACADTHDGIVCVDEGYYYVQRDAKWQAPCTEVSTANAEGAWGDNLTGDAMLKVGSPIRVELVLWESAGVGEGQLGYKVIKLEPAELDRLSAYGHLADDSTGSWKATAVDLSRIVHDPEATLRIERLVNGVPAGMPEYDGVAGGEINATGKIVYGYNLRVAVPGIYRITYTLPNVQLDGCEDDEGVCENNVAYLDINVVMGGGGGGGKGGGKGGGRPIKPGK